jgi:thioredoxin-like negative regulator of GroEL
MSAQSTAITERLLQADRLLVVGLTEQARAIYQEVLEAEPSDAHAIVGLANCAVELGNDRAAYDLAVRALELDRTNEVARRLEARLSEVMAARGTPVQRPRWIASVGR